MLYSRTICGVGGEPHEFKLLMTVLFTDPPSFNSSGRRVEINFLKIGARRVMNMKMRKIGFTTKGSLPIEDYSDSLSVLNTRWSRSKSKEIQQETYNIHAMLKRGTLYG